jgi:hypothetical protein
MCASAPPVGWFHRAFLANLGNARAIGGRDVEGRELADSKQKTGRAASAAPPKGGAMREADYTALAQFRYQLRTFLAFSETAAQNCWQSRDWPTPTAPASAISPAFS